jgi:hypothetical protein
VYETIDFVIRGLSPLMMHNGRLANPYDPIVRQIKEITGKRSGKTEADATRLMDLEFEGGLYLDDDGCVVVPGENIEGMIAGGGVKNERMNKSSYLAGIICDGAWPLKYEGPKAVAGLMADHRFRDVRGVVVDNKRVMRCRPIFRSWSLEFTVHYMPETINPSQVYRAVETAGRIVGLCEYTPKFGRFVVESPAAPEAAPAEPKAKKSRVLAG